MATLALQQPKDEFLNTFLKPEQNMLVIKSINKTPILTRYYPKKTNVKSVIETLLNKIKYTFNAGGSEPCENPNIILKYNNNYLTEEEKMLSEYGISKRYEEVNIAIKPRNLNLLNYGNPTDIVSIMKSRNQGKKNNQYFIKTLTGKTVTLNLPKDALVYEMKAAFCLKEGTPMDQQRMIFKGIEMEMEETVSNLANKESTFHVVLRLCGGMFHEVSGRDGQYADLKEIDGVVFDIDPIEDENQK